LADRITLLEGSSVDPEIFGAVCDWVRAAVRPMVVLDSSHTSEHVRRELDLYSTLVKKDGYLIVCDTIIDEMAQEGIGAGRPWGAGNSPMTAVTDFLSSTDRFVVDEAIDDKLLITVSPRGYLKCVKD
jgi:cephalosporin hydroxylase